MASVITQAPAYARENPADAAPINKRHLDMTRERANKRPRSEQDQALVNGWPLYRTDRGQAAFNHAMATLKATDVAAAPALQAFKGCKALHCKLSLPKIGSDGWIPAGRLWVSPSEYVLFVKSPRRRRGRSYRRRSRGSMRYFVFHEFQNSTHNTDPYDTLSAHSGSVFVPFYMGKKGTDAYGHRYVIVVQVAPYDVRSIHASNKGSAGPGIEVAKNTAGSLERLQGLAGILVAVMVKKAASHLRVVHHRGAEGRPMLRAYQKRLSVLRRSSRGRAVKLPFVPAPRQRVASAASRLGDLIKRRGVSPSRQFAARASRRTRSLRMAFNRPKRAIAQTTNRRIARVANKMTSRRVRPAIRRPTGPVMSPLAAYLRANIISLKRLPGFADVIPTQMASIGEVPSQRGIVYLLDANGKFLGRIEARKRRGVALAGKYQYTSLEGVSMRAQPFELDLSRPISVRMASFMPGRGARKSPKLVGPIQQVLRTPTPTPTPVTATAGGGIVDLIKRMVRSSR